MAGNSETISDMRQAIDINTSDFLVIVTTTGGLLGSEDGEQSGFHTVDNNVSLDNSGRISGLDGVDLWGNGGSLVNRASGSIGGEYGVVTTLGDDDAIVNAGLIQGSYCGVYLASTHNRLLNTGTISSGSFDAIVLSNNDDVITNTGTITSGSGTALEARGAASIIIHNSGTMDGDVKFTAGSNVYDGIGGTIDGALTGGTGNDKFDLSHQTITGLVSGGGGDDKIGFATANGGMTIDLLHGIATGAGESFHLSAISQVAGSGFADQITGDSLANVIASGAGNDIVSGGGGNDTINGGAGRDALVGGAGADVFRFTAASDSPYGGNPDVITDFTSGSDKIDLTALHLTSTAQITIVTAQGNSFVIVDADNNGTPDMMIEVLGANAVKLGDIATGIAPSAATAHSVAADAHDLAAAHFVAVDHGLYG